MNRDFIEALATCEPLAPVQERLLSIEIDTHRKMLDQLTEDFEDAQRVRRAMLEPADSFPHKWAEAYMQEARAQFAAMSADEQERALIRAEAEVQYWAKIKASSQHSTK